MVAYFHASPLITTAFDWFTICYIFANLALVLILLLDHLVYSILGQLQYHSVSTNPEPDFYQQVKDLLEPSTDNAFSVPLSPASNQIRLTSVF